MNTQLAVKSVKIGNYKFELFVNVRNQPVCYFKQLMTRGKNKGTYKEIESYYFATEEKRKTYIENKIARIKEIEKDEEDRKEKKSAANKDFINPFKVGEVFYHSWGYEQTNIEFYQIVEVGAKSVKFREIAQNIVPNSEGFMSEYVTPAIDKFIGETFTKVVKIWINYKGEIETSCGFSEYTSGEKGVYQSHYA